MGEMINEFIVSGALEFPLPKPAYTYSHLFFILGNARTGLDQYGKLRGRI
jgi:hypothetical protein